MRNYTTLGQGKATKVLAIAEHQPARTVTTTDAAAAAEIARALVRTDRQMAAALYPVAVDLNGAPVEARRHLLGVYDQAAAGAVNPGRGGLWQTGEELVARAGQAVAGSAAAVAAAVRAEVADHLSGLDGVLVPARVSTPGYKRANLDLVISGPLDWLGNEWLDYTVAHGHLDVVDDDDLFPTGGPCISTIELHQIVEALYNAEPAGKAWHFDFSVADLNGLLSDDSALEVGVRVDHFLAWVAHHRPERLADTRAALGLS